MRARNPIYRSIWAMTSLSAMIACAQDVKMETMENKRSNIEKSTGAEKALTQGTGWEEVFMGGSQEAEKKLFAEVLPKITAIQQTVAARQNAKVRRAFHNKGDPVRIALKIADDLPVSLRAGFLKPGAAYDGFGRFSRSQSYSREDKSLDERGFAFRVKTEDGPQDVVLSNTPVSFASDPVTFVKAGEIFANSNVLTAPFKLAQEFGPWVGFGIAKNLLFKTPDRKISFTSQRYWSRVPFQLGPGPVAVKIILVPVPDVEVRASGNGPAFLMEHLTEELRQGEKMYKVCVQLFVDENKTPIEDAAKEWKEQDSPLIPIGQLVILQQDLDGEDAKVLAGRVENTEGFNPWNTTHLRPLGSMNRARKEAYDLSAITRGGRPLGIGG